MRACMLSSVVCVGVWFGIRSGTKKGTYRMVSSPIRNDGEKNSLCSGASVSDSEVPSGYTLMGLKQIDGKCFAMLKAEDIGGVPAVGGGVADVSGPDGRLAARFVAITLPNGQWEVMSTVA